MEILKRAFLMPALVAAMFLPVSAMAQVDEYRVKAAFLYNFAKFVDWPAQAFKTPTAPIVICVLGPSPFGNTLQQTISGRVAAGRSFTVRQLSDPALSTSCQILFVSSSQCKQFRQISARLKGAGVLSVGEVEGFTAEGGIINFKVEDGRVRFAINVAAADYADIRISAKLLSLATVVQGVL